MKLLNLARLSVSKSSKVQKRQLKKLNLFYAAQYFFPLTIAASIELCFPFYGSSVKLLFINDHMPKHQKKTERVSSRETIGIKHCLRSRIGNSLCYFQESLRNFQFGACRFQFQTMGYYSMDLSHEES